MKLLRLISVLAIGLAAAGAVAQAPTSSLRPEIRPGTTTAIAGQAETAQTEEIKPERKGLFKSLRPLLRPREVRRQARLEKKLKAKGAVCGDLDIQGQLIGRVPGKIAGCGVPDAVKVRSISGVALSQQSVMDCTTAQTLKSWIDTGLKPAVGSTGGGVVRLRIAAHYACRTRNSKKGAKISEHGKGRAIDIAAFQLRDGSEISVLKDWGRGSHGRILKKLHRSACGSFGTVLGPNADRHHRDHFHFDTARYRSGSYCR